MPSIEQLEKLLSLDPLDPFLLYGLAQEHAKAGNTSKAVDLYDQCLAADPAYCYAYYHKAKAFLAAQNPELAIQTIQAGIVAARTHRDHKALGELEALADEI